jgi:hypothetical protein
LGDFIETKAKKSPTSPGLVSPDADTNQGPCLEQAQICSNAPMSKNKFSRNQWSTHEARINRSLICWN